MNFLYEIYPLNNSNRGNHVVDVLENLLLFEYDLLLGERLIAYVNELLNIWVVDLFEFTTNEQTSHSN